MKGGDKLRGGLRIHSPKYGTKHRKKAESMRMRCMDALGNRGRLIWRSLQVDGCTTVELFRHSSVPDCKKSFLLDHQNNEVCSDYSL